MPQQISEPAVPPEPQPAQPSAPSAKGGKKSSPLIVIIIVAVLVLGVIGYGVWKLFLTNHTENFESAKNAIEDDWTSFVASMYLQAWGGGKTEEEMLGEYEEMLTGAQDEMKGIICWRVKKPYNDDCTNLRKSLKDAKNLSEDIRKIYEKEQEEDKADELAEKEDQLSDINTDISEILNN